MGIIGKTLTSFLVSGRIITRNDLFVADSMHISFVSYFGLLSVEVAMQLFISLYNASFLLEYYLFSVLFQADFDMLSILAINAYSRSSLPEKLPLACSSA